MKKLFFASMLTILASGCATQTFDMNGRGVSVPDRQKMQVFYISGIAQKQSINAARVCGGVRKVAKVETQLSFVDGLLGAVTLGIFTPRTAKVYCVR